MKYAMTKYLSFLWKNTIYKTCLLQGYHIKYKIHCILIVNNELSEDIFAFKDSNFCNVKCWLVVFLSLKTSYG